MGPSYVSGGSGLCVSKLRREDSNLQHPDPESGVLPVGRLLNAWAGTPCKRFWYLKTVRAVNGGRKPRENVERRLGVFVEPGPCTLGLGPLGGDRIRRAPQPRERPLAADQLDDLEDPRARRAAGERDAHGLRELAEAEAARRHDALEHGLDRR